jgi:hypothetical protein
MRQATTKVGMTLAAVVMLAIALLAFDFVFFRTFGIPPRALTRTRMWVIKRRVLQYAHHNGSLPKRIDNLPEMPGYDNETIDWWGNSIHYEVEPDGRVVLSSEGGSVWGYKASEGAPLTCRFPSKDPSGEWSDELVDFIEDN